MLEGSWYQTSSNSQLPADSETDELYTAESTAPTCGYVRNSEQCTLGVLIASGERNVPFSLGILGPSLGRQTFIVWDLDPLWPGEKSRTAIILL